MIVVLDTNVLVAAFIARGVCADIFERVVTDHQLVASPQLLGEFERVMTGKLGFREERVQRAVTLLRKVANAVEPKPLERPVCRDPDDDAVLALARATRASCVVTGDDDLLVLESFAGIPIITPRAFLTFVPPEFDG